MPEIFQGRIVYPHLSVADPQGQNPKAGRPFVVISHPDNITAGKDLSLVAITTWIKGEDDEIQLPWGPDHRVKTRLTENSVAKCSWRTPPPPIAQNEVEVSKGFVPPTYLREILMKVAELTERPPGGE